MNIEPFVLMVALVPLGLYLVLFGLLRLSGRPFATTGARDTFALAIAVSGLIAVGPAELFFPTAAAAAFGIAIWPVLAFLYLLVITLVILSARPRLIVYGKGIESLKQPLLRAAKGIDADAKLDDAGGQIILPSLVAHLRIDATRAPDVTEILSYETSLAPSFWNRLLSLVREELKCEESTTLRRGGTALAIGAAMLLLVSIELFRSHEQVVQGFRDWLWR